MEKLSREFYLRDTVTVARELLGMRLVFIDGQDNRLAVEINETEAYTGVSDKACHAYGDKRTARTEALYLAGGHAYIYFIYGMYYMLNVVTEPEGSPCAVLLRGAIPAEGHDMIARNRFGINYASLDARRKKSLLDGPGKLCSGLGLTKEQNKLDLLGDRLFIERPDMSPSFAIGVSKRIGIDYAEEAVHYPYRFFQQR